MYEVNRNGKTILEADACGIGFLASRKGIAERSLVEKALELVKYFDHRGAPGHGAGLQIDIPWPLLLERFSSHARIIAQRDIALGMFFMPYDAALRSRCVNRVEELANLAGATVLQWADVPVNPNALPPGSSALRTLPVVRQALFQRPAGISEAAWFTCRYLLRMALDHELNAIAGDEFAITSLSNRTVIYKGLSELSKIADLYPDLNHPDFASRFVLFHSRYCTNTTTAWRRAQPFWAIAHNGEISTIDGNSAWMNAIGNDLIQSLVQKYPFLKPIAEKTGPIVSPSGSDTAHLDDMLISLIAGGMTLTQAILALLPTSEKTLPAKHKLREFYRAAKVYFGACDGPAAIVACDGDNAVAHLDRNGLRPLWLCTSEDYVLASSELTGALDLGPVQTQRIMGPGETVQVNLGSGTVAWNDEVRDAAASHKFPTPGKRLIKGISLQVDSEFEKIQSEHLLSIQKAVGMKAEDISVILKPLFETGKAAIGSMGDDTPPSAMLDFLPRRIEDHFALRFAQETSPPIDPIRDAWVFDTTIFLGDRRGPWCEGSGEISEFSSPVLSLGELAWVKSRPLTEVISLCFDAELGLAGHELRLSELVESAISTEATVLIFSDRGINADKISVQPLRALSLVHRALVKASKRNRVSLVADVAVWDIHHVALLATLGTDAVCPWLGSNLAGEKADIYIKGIRSGLTEVMSMMGITPAVAYCGARLAETVGLDPEWVREEFEVPCHLGGIAKDVVTNEWLELHRSAFCMEDNLLVDAGEFRYSKDGRPHSNNAEIVRALHIASGYQKKIHAASPGSFEAYKQYSSLISERPAVNPLDCIELKKAANGTSIPLSEVESVESIAWRFMAPGMSEGALSEPAHRTVARGMNVLHRYCRIASLVHGSHLSGLMGPFANSGEGGFEKSRIGTGDGNTSVQYAGGRFTITPFTAANAKEAEVKFAQGAKPGKGGQLPGKKVSVKVAQQRGCEPGYELVSPPINHNLYSIEDVKIMLESWRFLNPHVNCSLKFVATHGVEMVTVGGVNAGANRLHISDGCGGTGAAKRVDQKHAGVPVMAVLPKVQDLLVEENLRHLVELSVDGGVQNGEQALKLFLMGADRVGFGTSLLISIGCSMLRKCHLSGPDPSDITGKRRLGCTPGVATQDPQWIARFSGNWKHIARTLLFVAEEIRERMAEAGIRSLSQVIGRRELLVRKEGLVGKAALLDVSSVLRASHAFALHRDYDAQSVSHSPSSRKQEIQGAWQALEGETIVVRERITNQDRCIGVGAAGVIARFVRKGTKNSKNEFSGDMGLVGLGGELSIENVGAAGHYYAAYSLPGMKFKLQGVAADSCFTAAYGGELVIIPDANLGISPRESSEATDLCLVGNSFGYGAREGRAFIAGRGGNRFGICLRQSHERTGPTIVVEGVGANAFQYMTGGTALVLGSTGFNLGSGLTGGVVYLLDPARENLNSEYVKLIPLHEADIFVIEALLRNHIEKTGSPKAQQILEGNDWNRFGKVITKLLPEDLA